MLTPEQLKQAVHRPGMTKTNMALLCVAAAGGKQATTTAVKKLAVEAGVRGAKKINFSAHLASAEDKVFRTPEGWELTDVGQQHVAGLVGESLSVSPAANEAQTLRVLLPKIKNEDARAFLTEAIVCAEQSLFRAAVVLSWVGAMALLYDVAVTKHLAPFNVEASRRDSKWKPAKTADDLSRMKETTFLQIAESISMLGKNVKQELEGSCGSAIRVGIPIL